MTPLTCPSCGNSDPSKIDVHGEGQAAECTACGRVFVAEGEPTPSDDAAVIGEFGAILARSAMVVDRVAPRVRVINRGTRRVTPRKVMS